MFIDRPGSWSRPFQSRPIPASEIWPGPGLSFFMNYVLTPFNMLQSFPNQSYRRYSHDDLLDEEYEESNVNVFNFDSASETFCNTF